jgi:hypothetical protein
MDFLQHLIDAPVANILIVAGLLFLGVGAVGKVTGKIEPDKSGRLMAGVLGLILLIVGVIFHVGADAANKSASNQTQTDSKQAESSPVQPIVHVFSVTPAQITKGNKVTIQWEVLNADDVELEPFGQVSPTGRTTDQPQQTTVYKLSASNRNGGKAGDFHKVIVNEREPAKTVKQTPEVPKQTPEVTPSRLIPNFAGTWELTEFILNGREVPVTNIKRFTITQKGWLLRIGNEERQIDSTGKVVHQEFLANDNQSGHAVKTDAEADADLTDILRLEGPFLIRETIWLYKRQYGKHPPGTDSDIYKYRRISPE